MGTLPKSPADAAAAADVDLDSTDWDCTTAAVVVDVVAVDTRDIPRNSHCLHLEPNRAPNECPPSKLPPLPQPHISFSLFFVFKCT